MFSMVMSYRKTITLRRCRTHFVLSDLRGPDWSEMELMAPHHFIVFWL